jgi:hypothetical protein
MTLFSSKQTINLEKSIQRKDNILSSEIDHEMVLMSIENSEYYGLDQIGTRIWQLIEKPQSPNELVNILVNEYDITREQCMEDTLSFIEILAEKNLILIKGRIEH